MRMSGGRSGRAWRGQRRSRSGTQPQAVGEGRRAGADVQRDDATTPAGSRVRGALRRAIASASALRSLKRQDRRGDEPQFGIPGEHFARQIGPAIRALRPSCPTWSVTTASGPRSSCACASSPAASAWMRRLVEPLVGGEPVRGARMQFRLFRSRGRLLEPAEQEVARQRMQPEPCASLAGHHDRRFAAPAVPVARPDPSSR